MHAEYHTGCIVSKSSICQAIYQHCNLEHQDHVHSREDISQIKKGQMWQQLEKMTQERQEWILFINGHLFRKKYKGPSK